MPTKGHLAAEVAPRAKLGSISMSICHEKGVIFRWVRPSSQETQSPILGTDGPFAVVNAPHDA